MTSVALGENKADDDGAEDEQYRRIHEVLEGHFRFPDEKHGLEYSDCDTGDTDRQDLKNPPGSGQGKERQSSLALSG